MHANLEFEWLHIIDLKTIDGSVCRHQISHKSLENIGGSINCWGIKKDI